jgi:uncharacterized protein (TIGR02246 family)
MWKLCLSGGLVLLLSANALAQKLPEKKSADAAEPIRKTLRAYAEAFNKNDAKTTAAFWAPKGVYVDRDTGERTEGREAIQADFAKLFKEHRGARLTANVTSVRFIKPDVAMVEGVSTVFRPGEDPNESSFSAVLVKEGTGWLIDSVQESDTPTPPTAAEALKDLAFLVGQWHDKTDGIRVEYTVRWSAKKSFLIRSYIVQREKEEEHQGTQVIGWDPRAKRIRSWSFDSDGSFGDETWSKVDGDWVVKMTRTLADGGASSGTQIISIKDDNTLTVQVVAREVDGEPAPAGEPVTVVREQKEGEKIGAAKTSERTAEKTAVEKVVVEKTVIEKAPAAAPRR